MPRCSFLDLQIVDEPDQFHNAMSSLLQFKDDNCPKDHICFVGSGLEEDDSYMMMVISRFLQHNREHISYVDGGYKGTVVDPEIS